MAKSFEFTDKFLQGKECKPRDKQFYIREKHGFAIRVLPSGVITFLYIYTLNGKRRQKNLGNYPHTKLSDARRLYRDAANLVADNIDPQTITPPEAPKVEPEIITLAELKKQYIKHIKTHLVPRSVKHQDERLENHLIPVWGNKDITSVRRRDAILLIEGIATKKTGAARNVLLAARAMYSYAVHREMVEFNPFSGVGVAVPQAAPKSRERTLSDDEIKHVWRSLSNWSGSEIIRRAILLILVTGQRPGEVAGVHSSEITVGIGNNRCHMCRRCGWWTIPAERSKNGRENQVYLSNLALSLIPTFDKHIFPASRGADGPVIVNSLAHHLSHHVTPPYLGLPRWTPHDLRRTAATGLASIGCPDEIIDEIQNHKKRGVIRTYNRYRYDKEKQEWLTKWTDHLSKLIVI